jgi:hypothetical protein
MAAKMAIVASAYKKSSVLRFMMLTFQAKKTDGVGLPKFVRALQALA